MAVVGGGERKGARYTAYPILQDLLCICGVKGVRILLCMHHDTGWPFGIVNFADP